MILFLFSSSFGFASEVQRESLVKIADKGLNYFFSQAFLDPAFTNNLTVQEKKMAADLMPILELTSGLRWFRQNQIPHFTTQRNGQTIHSFAYVDLKEEVVTFNSVTVDPPDIKPSQNRDEFKALKPGEPERLAKTDSLYGAPILINIKGINENPNDRFDLGDAVSLLVHEYGHKVTTKIEPDKIQSITNALGVKLGEYIRGKINLHKLKNGVVLYSLFFKSYPYAEWLDRGFLKGQVDLRTGQPGEFAFMGRRTIDDRLLILPDQGFWAWTEFDNKITDVTQEILAKAKKTDLIGRQFPEEKYYQFVRHDMYSVGSFKVTENVPGNVVFDLQLTQVSAVIPFMIPSISPPPDKAEFNKRYYFSQLPYVINPITTELSGQYNGSLLRVSQASEDSRVMYQAPHLSLTLTKQENINKKLRFEIQVSGLDKPMGSAFNNIQIPFDQCELMLKTNEGFFYILSKEFNKATSSFVFELVATKSDSLQSLQITKANLKTSTNKLVDNTFSTRASIPLFQNLQLDPPKGDFSVQPYNLNITNIESLPGGGLRLVMESAERLANLSLTLGAKNSTYALWGISDKKETVYRKQTDNIDISQKFDIVLDASQMSQRFEAGKLVIDLAFSKIYQLYSQDQVSSQKTSGGLIINAFAASVIDSTMTVDKVIATSESLKVTRFNYTNKEISISSSDPIYLRIHGLSKKPMNTTTGLYQCRSLFD